MEQAFIRTSHISQLQLTGYGFFSFLHRASPEHLHYGELQLNFKSKVQSLLQTVLREIEFSFAFHVLIKHNTQKTSPCLQLCNNNDVLDYSISFRNRVLILHLIVELNLFKLHLRKIKYQA